jgi:hypothetical protein
MYQASKHAMHVALATKKRIPICLSNSLTGHQMSTGIRSTDGVKGQIEACQRTSSPTKS